MHPTKATKVEWVHEPRGVFISHVLVIVNKTIQASHSRARYYMPRCEFRHGPRDGLRKYPDVRLSVFSDTPQNSAYENWGKPEDMPRDDTHSYRFPLVESKALSMDPPKTEVGADADVDSGSEDVEVGSGEEDVDFDGEDEESYSYSSEDSSAIKTDSDQDMYKSESEKMIAEFHTLEQRWKTEENETKKYELQRAVSDLEVKYAVTHGVYRDLLTGERTEEGLAKEKTRNRMRTRREQKRCIGLPVKGRASQPKKKRRKQRDRMLDKKVIDWSSFRRERQGWTMDELLKQWRTYPRVARPVTHRMFKDQRLSWTECTQRFGDYYEPSELHKWYINLQRAASR